MIDLNELRTYCLARPGSSAGYPFGEGAEVFKVGGKMFALIREGERPLAINLKCDPDWALMLRDAYTAVTPGYHMNKRHWNTINLDGTVPDDEIREMIDHSYGLVVQSLTRRQRAELGANE